MAHLSKRLRGVEPQDQPTMDSLPIDTMPGVRNRCFKAELDLFDRIPFLQDCIESRDVYKASPTAPLSHNVDTLEFVFPPFPELLYDPSTMYLYVSGSIWRRSKTGEHPTKNVTPNAFATDVNSADENDVNDFDPVSLLHVFTVR
jgi:hypothetical protein